MARVIVTVNAGSSSIKLCAYTLAGHEPIQPQLLASAQAVDIGLPAAALQTALATGASATQPLQPGDQSSAVAALLYWLTGVTAGHTLFAIGHRLVHGGPHHVSSEPITPQLEADLSSLEPFDPDHLPVARQLIAALRRQFAAVPQVACFDTAFFHDLPRLAQIIPLPRQYEAHGLRRYGFHGLSYQYLLSQLREQFGAEVADGRLILAHLGSGASLAAVHRGRPVDTTMSLTPASGIMMSSRSGDLDPGVGWYLHQQAGVSPEEFNRLVNTRSGLLGVSGLSADMYTLLQNQAANPAAAEAVDLFCYLARKAIGALTATLSGLDTLVFSGGMGEASEPVRARICAGLEYLGVQLDPAANRAGHGIISTSTSPVRAIVLPTNESHVIATETLRVINNKG